ncbi:kelch-like protein 20 [Trichonephila clavipes]|nr:kelch-like protein 20 [Trichonephila clavipes]
MTGHIYRDVILEQHVRLFRGAMGAEFLFMDDNARPRRANIVDKCLQSEDITRMDGPAYSPDVNSVEHVWDMLRRRITARQPPPTCLPELRRALLDEWCNIPQDQIDNLILTSCLGVANRREDHPIVRNALVTANCFIGRHPCTGSSFIRRPCVFSNHRKAPGCKIFGIVEPITCAALHAHSSTPSFEVPRMRKLDCSGMEPDRL